MRAKARTDTPLRELLQGRGGSPHELYAVGGDGGAGAPKIVGTLIYEFRMAAHRAAVHSFMQRFPDVATLAMMEVRPGARTSECVVTVHKATGLRLRRWRPAGAVRALRLLRV